MITWQQLKHRIDLYVFKKVLTECLSITNEQILIIGDYGLGNKFISPIITNGYALAARALGFNYNVIMQNAKTRGDYADEVMVSALKKLPEKSVIIMNVSNRIGRLGSLGNSFRKFCYENKHKFVTSSSLGSLSNESLKTVLRTMDVNYKNMHAKGERIKKILDNGTELNVTTKLGTDLTMDITGVRAIVNSGLYNHPGMGGNMPAGEVYLHPVEGKTNGTFVIDGSMRLKDRTLLVNNPVRVDVEEGSITRISSNYEGKLFQKTLDWAHWKSKKPLSIRKIAEFGIGINPNAKLIGATIIDEKTPDTVHIANGSNAWFGGEIKSIIHLDHVIKKPLIKVDGRLLRV